MVPCYGCLYSRCLMQTCHRLFIAPFASMLSPDNLSGVPYKPPLCDCSTLITYIVFSLMSGCLCETGIPDSSEEDACLARDLGVSWETVLKSEEDGTYILINSAEVQSDRTHPVAREAAAPSNKHQPRPKAPIFTLPHSLSQGPNLPKHSYTHPRLHSPRASQGSYTQSTHSPSLQNS